MSLTKSILTVPLGALLLASTASAQLNAVELLRIGDTLPGGDQVTTISHLRVNDAGSWAAILRTDHPNPNRNSRVVRDGQTVLAAGDPAIGLPGLLVLEIIDCDLDDSGRLAVIVNTSAGNALYYEGVRILGEFTPVTAPGFGPNAEIASIAKVNSNDDDNLLLRCRVFDPSLPIPITQCLLRIEVGPGGAIVSQGLLRRQGETPPGLGAPIAAFTESDNALSFSDNGEGTWAGTLAPGTLPGEEIAFSSAPLSLFQGGAAAPFGSRDWLDRKIRATAANPSGSWAFSAKLDASNIDNDDVIIVDAAVYAREGANLTAFPGAPFIESLGYQGLFLTDAGEPIFWVEVAATSPMTKAIVRGGTPLLFRGQELVGGTIISDIVDIAHGFHASDNGKFLLAKVELDNSDIGLVYQQSEIGTAYCAAEPNSTGVPAVTSAEGVSLTHANALVITTRNAPPGQFGLYLASRAAGVVLFPGGSAGRLCLGGSIGRYNSLVGQISGAGNFTIRPDLTSIPVFPAATVMPGDTWRFQLWFREPPSSGETSNYSLPVRVDFH